MNRATSLIRSKISSRFALAVAKSKIPPRFIPSHSHFTPTHRRLLSATAVTPLPPPRNPTLSESFDAASTTAEILAAFSALEPTLSPNSLALACLKVAQHLAASADNSQSLSYALRALSILDTIADNSSIVISLHLAAAASFNLRKFNDSLGYLNRANRILLKHDSTNHDFAVGPVSHAVQLLLANTKTALGRQEEALGNLRKCFEIKETLLEPGSKEMGTAYRDLAEAYVGVLDFEEALGLCKRGLEIHEAILGPNSVEVAHDRRLLGVIYMGLEQNEKALDENRRSQKVMKRWGMWADVVQTDICAANVQITLGKYDEAIAKLKEVVEQIDSGSEMQGLVYIMMAKALCHQEKVDDSKRCLGVAVGILEKTESVSPSVVSEAYNEAAELYESMNELETAFSLLKRSLMVVEKLPQEQHVEGTVMGRIGWLLLLTGKFEEALPYLEGAAERLKESFGPKHCAVGYIYKNLGAAYMKMERPQSASQMLAVAKDIMDFSMGSHHADSIEVCQSLANAYKACGSYSLATEFQQEVVDEWENHGLSAEDELRAANKLLEELKMKTFGTLPGADFKRNCEELIGALSDADVKKFLHDLNATVSSIVGSAKGVGH